jgi:hypothetical protein
VSVDWLLGRSDVMEIHDEERAEPSPAGRGNAIT